MMTGIAKQNKMRPARTEIRAIESQYSASYIAEVVLDITLRWPGVAVTITHERRAEALGHLVAAWVLDATPEDERWGVSTKCLTSYRDVSVIRVSLEMASGDEREAAAARVLIENAAARL